MRSQENGTRLRGSQLRLERGLLFLVESSMRVMTRIMTRILKEMCCIMAMAGRLAGCCHFLLEVPC